MHHFARRVIGTYVLLTTALDTGIERFVHVSTDEVYGDGLNVRDSIHAEDRPGHDRRYAIDCTKARQKLDCVPLIPFEDGLGNTVDWCVTEFPDSYRKS